MCAKLVVRMRRRHPYLRAVCDFLHAHSATASRTPGGGGAVGDMGASMSGAEPAAHASVTATTLWQRSPYFRVLSESGVALSDRVAFACRYLPDAEVRRVTRHWLPLMHVERVQYLTALIPCLL